MFQISLLPFGGVSSPLMDMRWERKYI
jgi:hypothetical protein